MNAKDSKDFYELIDDYLKLWPRKINISGHFIEGKPSPFKDLILAHDTVEEYLFELCNNKLWVLDWSVFKYFQSLAKQKNTVEILIDEINLKPIERIYLKDIQQWREDYGEP